MDIRKIKKLIEMLEASGIAELEITEGEESVRISRYGQTPPMPAMPYPPQAYNLAPPPAAAPAKAVPSPLPPRLKTRKNKPTSNPCNSTAAASTTKPCNSCALPNAAAAAAAPSRTPSSC